MAQCFYVYVVHDKVKAAEYVEGGPDSDWHIRISDVTRGFIDGDVYCRTMDGNWFRAMEFTTFAKPQYRWEGIPSTTIPSLVRMAHMIGG